MPIEKFCENLGCLIWGVVYKEMSARQSGLAHVRAILAPFRWNIEESGHLTCRTVEDEGWAHDLALDIGGVMLEIDDRRGAVVRTGTMNHARIAPCPAIFREHFSVEVGNFGGPPSGEASLVERVRVIADHALREGRRLR